MNVFGGSRNPKNHAPATVRAQFSLKSQFAAGGPKSSPKASQNGAQKPPWRPKTAPKGAKSRPRRSKSGPTDAKTAPKGHQERFQRGSWAAIWGQLPPKRRPDASGRPSWPPRGSIFEPPGADFRGLGRYVGTLAGSTFACLEASSNAAPQKPQRLEHAESSRAYPVAVREAPG